MVTGGEYIRLHHNLESAAGAADEFCLLMLGLKSRVLFIYCDIKNQTNKQTNQQTTLL